MTHLAAGAGQRGQGICRTCLAPIWNEGGTVGGRRRAEGWSDRIEPGGDSLVCFKAVEYRHVPLTGREAAIYDNAYERGCDRKGGAICIDPAVVSRVEVVGDMHAAKVAQNIAWREAQGGIAGVMRREW